MTRWRVVLCVVLAGALWATPAAVAGWSPPRTVSSAAPTPEDETPGLTGPVLAANRRGQAAMAWFGRHGVELALLRHGRVRRLGPIRGVRDDAPPAQIRVALADSGHAVVAWLGFSAVYKGDGHWIDDCCFRVRAAVYSPGRGLSRARTLSEIPTSEQEHNNGTLFVVLGRTDEAQLVWAGEECRVVGVRLDAAGAEKGRAAYSSCAVASRSLLGPVGGDVLVAGDGLPRLRWNGGTFDLVPTRVRVPKLNYFEAATDDHGRTTLLGDQQHGPVTALTLGRKAIEGRPRRVVPRAALEWDTELEVDHDGWGILGVVQRGIAEDFDRLSVAVRRPNGQIGRMRPVADRTSPGAHAVAAGPDGRAVATWMNPDLTALRVATVRRDGRPRQATRFRLRGRIDGDCIDILFTCDGPALATLPTGEIYVAWRESTRIRLAHLRRHTR